MDKQHLKDLTETPDSKSLCNGAAWMNDKIIPISEAMIPVTDWGLTHSDITYDVVPVWNGGFFRIDDYINRFHVSMKSLRLDPGMSRDEIQSALIHMVAASGLRNSYVAMVCSRGSPTIRGSRDPRDCANHFYAWCVPYVHIIKPELISTNATALIAQSVRRIPDDSVNPLTKNYHWADFTKGLFEAKDNNYETVILADHDNNITEGPGFNVFAVINNKIVTSNHGVLAGISRRTVLEMAASLNIKTEIRNLFVDELLDADEVFISTSGGGVIPLIKVNDTIYANGACGPLTHKLNSTYWEWMASPTYRTDIDYKT